MADPRSEDYEPDFDFSAELDALRESGYVFPLPAVTRAFYVADRVRALGFEGARVTAVARLDLSALDEEVLWRMVGLIVERAGRTWPQGDDSPTPFSNS